MDGWSSLVCFVFSGLREEDDSEMQQQQFKQLDK
jgi:hypothetical protein